VPGSEPAPSPREMHAACVLPGQGSSSGGTALLVTGGREASGSVCSDAWVLNTGQSTHAVFLWTAQSDPPGCHRLGPDPAHNRTISPSNTRALRLQCAGRGTAFQTCLRRAAHTPRQSCALRYCPLATRRMVDPALRSCFASSAALTVLPDCLLTCKCFMSIIFRPIRRVLKVSVCHGLKYTSFR
jgi:hypothetical protein